MSNNKQESDLNLESLKLGKKITAPFGIATISQKQESNLEPESSLTNAKQAHHQAILSEIQKSGPIEEDLGNMNINKIQQFTDAWKSQSNFSILLIEKLSLIVNNYFKMLSEMGQRNEQIQVLIIYNKSLIEILNKFEDHEKKLMQKVRTLEEFNLKAMKELCALKRRHFDPPQAKPEESIFAKFSLRNLKYEPKKKQPQKPDEKYQQKIENLFKQYLLEKTEHLIPTIELKVKQEQIRYKQQIQSSERLKIQAKIEQLQQLLQNVVTYNKQLDQLNCQNMFDLYELKWEIRNQMKLLNLQINMEEDKAAEAREKMFVNDVKKIHAGLNSMSEGQLQNYLRKEKEIRKKMKKLRVKEQEVFLRACEEVQNQNIELKEDIKKLKEKLLHAEDYLNHARAQIQFKNMKQKRTSKSNVILDQSSFLQGQSRHSSKKVQQQKKMKENYEKLNKAFEQIQLQKKIHDKQREMVFLRIKQFHIQVQENMKCSEMMKAVLMSYEKLKKDLQQKKLDAFLGASTNREQDSCLPSKSIEKSNAFPPLSNSIKILNSKIKQMSQELNDLQTKNHQLQQRISQQNLKQKEDRIQCLQKQVAELQENSIKNQSKLLKQIQSKTENLKKSEKQLQELRQETKKLAQTLKESEFFQESAEKLAQKIIKAVEVLVHEDFTSQKFLIIMDKMFANLKDYIQEYKLETKKSRSFGHQDLYGEFQSQEFGINEDNKKIDKNKLENSSENIQNRASISLNFSKKSRGQWEFKQKNKQNELPKRTSVLKKQLSMPHFSLIKQKSFPEPLNESFHSKNADKISNESEIKDSIIFKNHEYSQISKQRIKNEGNQKIKIQTNQKFQKNGEESKAQKYEKKKEEQKKTEGLEIRKKQQKIRMSKTKEGDEILNGLILPRGFQKQKKTQEITAQKITKFQFKEKQQSQSITQKIVKPPSENSHKSSKNQSIYSKIGQEKKMSEPYFFKLNGILNPNPLYASNQQSQKQRQSIENSHTKFHPSSFLTSSQKNKGQQNSIYTKSERNSLGAEKSAISSKHHMNSVNLSLSEDQVQLEQELGILPHTYQLAPEIKSKKTASQLNLNQLNKSALDIGIELLLVDKMFEKFQRLHNDEDVLDFYQLFQRYKQALKCLQKSQQLNKLHQIRYQKYIETVKNKQKADPSFNLETRLHFLERIVLQQQEQLLQQKNQFENVFIEHIITSEKAINQHVKLMRKQNKVQRKFRS